MRPFDTAINLGGGPVPQTPPGPAWYPCRTPQSGFPLRLKSTVHTAGLSRRLLSRTAPGSVHSGWELTVPTSNTPPQNSGSPDSAVPLGTRGSWKPFRNAPQKAGCWQRQGSREQRARGGQSSGRLPCPLPTPQAPLSGSPALASGLLIHCLSGEPGPPSLLLTHRRGQGDTVAQDSAESDGCLRMEPPVRAFAIPCTPPL